MGFHLFHKPKWSRTRTNSTNEYNNRELEQEKWFELLLQLEKLNKWFKLVHIVKTKTQNYPPYTLSPVHLPHGRHLHTKKINFEWKQFELIPTQDDILKFKIRIKGTVLGWTLTTNIFWQCFVKRQPCGRNG